MIQHVDQRVNARLKRLQPGIFTFVSAHANFIQKVAAGPGDNGNIERFNERVNRRGAAGGLFSLCAERAGDWPRQSLELYPRTDNGSANMAAVKPMSLNLIRNSNHKASIKAPRKTLAWNDQYLKKAINGKS